MKLADIQIRDPFVLLDGDAYYLFGSTDKDIWRGKGCGFDAYRCSGNIISPDAEWTGPIPAFRPDENFWSQSNFWAPEIHRFNGSYYMFATFKPIGAPDGQYGRRGTAILKSASNLPEGPYLPHSEGPVTPHEWECLDGTFFEEDGKPYMIFCHEWQQVGDGQICVMPLSGDLRHACGEPQLLFRASEAPWTAPLKGRAPGSYVTDGPFLFRCSASESALGREGELIMLWSSFDKDGKYAIGIARSATGSLFGAWTQSDSPLYSADGGHGMIFRTKNSSGALADSCGKAYLAIHTPNDTPNERAVFIAL
ncbi:MAG: glycoside hydrolase family 43 protein [Treponemataceae bacterium]|nr:MAG: glycoside hydrolase family 43 protein [Treponemataceae bacterium]